MTRMRKRLLWLRLLWLRLLQLRWLWRRLLQCRDGRRKHARSELCRRLAGFRFASLNLPAQASAPALLARHPRSVRPARLRGSTASEPCSGGAAGTGGSDRAVPAKSTRALLAALSRSDSAGLPPAPAYTAVPLPRATSPASVLRPPVLGRGPIRGQGSVA